MRHDLIPLRDGAKTLLAGGLLAALTLHVPVRADSTDALIDKLVKKGVLTLDEGQELKTETRQEAAATAPAPESKWKINPGIKSVELFGDARFRYEYRGAETVAGDTLARERFRYALRLGIRGDLLDHFYYGMRVETAQNPRSPWVTFGDESSYPFPGPSSKTSDGINIGQVYVGWRTTDWLTLEVGKMANPLYTTAMVWDSDINPEGASERFKHSFGKFDLFATFGQFLYQDTNPDNPAPGISGGAPNKSDAFLLAWQLGAKYNFNTNMSLKLAPAIYNYTGHGQNGGYNGKFIGEGSATGGNPYDPTTVGFINQSGVNDLLVFETPGEFNFKVSGLNMRVFGDFAMNLHGGARAAAAGFRQFEDENMAYQVGLGIGNLGLAYGQTSRKGTWEARTYWQHVEQYALDVNLLDSDFFEGRGNLQGIYAAFAYSITDNIIGTVRYGYGDRIQKGLGTGGSNQDLPQLNPVTNYQLLQADLTYRF